MSTSNLQCFDIERLNPLELPSQSLSHVEPLLLGPAIPSSTDHNGASSESTSLASTHLNSPQNPVLVADLALLRCPLRFHLHPPSN